MNNEELNKQSDDQEQNDASNQDNQLQEPSNSENKFHLSYENEIPDYEAEAINNDKDIIIEKKKMHPAIKFTMVGLIILAVAVSLAMGIIIAAQDIWGFNKTPARVTIEIPKGSGTSSVAKILKETGYIKSELLFKAYCKLSKHDGNIYPGIYTELTQNMSYEILLDELSKYEPKDSVTVTFPEGLTLEQMAKKLEESKVCDAKTFIRVVNETDFNVPFMQNISVSELEVYKMEGFLFPDTYEFFKGDNPANVAKKMLDTFQTKVIEPNAELFANIPNGLSFEQIITLASIIQSEAPDKDQMHMVSSVFHNRLNNPADFANKLQSDPTRKYAEALQSKMEIVNQDIIKAYNTYEGQGIPPGAICNPGVKAIVAALSPTESDYYYFCSNLKTREFFYAKTLAQHNANLRKAGLR